jgi:L-arginine dehydrogenase
VTNAPLFLDAAQVQAGLKDLDVLGAMRSLFQALGEGRAVQPPQALTLFPEGQGDFITYSGVLAGERVFGLKVSPYLKTEGRPIVTAYTLLMSMETGRPVLLCDSFALTTQRTAATTALAVDLLARQDARRLSVIGSGPIALAHLKYVLPLRDWASIRITSLELPQNTEAIRPRLAALGSGIEIAENLRHALEDTDVVMLCTSSGQPVLDPADLGKPALITSISTNAPKAHEVPPESLKDMDVYCDYRATTPSIAGEMVLAQEQGWSPRALRGDLGELVTGRAALPDYSRHCFFRSVGLGLEDVQLALAIHQHISQGAVS